MCHKNNEVLWLQLLRGGNWRGGRGERGGKEGEGGVDTADVLVPLASGATPALITPSKSWSQVKWDVLLQQQSAEENTGVDDPVPRSQLQSAFAPISNPVVVVVVVVGVQQWQQQ